jgi:hypothetical protein
MLSQLLGGMESEQAFSGHRTNIRSALDSGHFQTAAGEWRLHGSNEWLSDISLKYFSKSLLKSPSEYQSIDMLNVSG